jgi:GT2 family glycosyltransferase
MSGVTAVVPNWNRRDLLEGLLRNLDAQTRPFERTIVVDNGSSDGSAECAERFGAQVIRLESNQGFARAVNVGIEAVASEWIAILNNDVELDPEWCERLLVQARREGAWFAAGKILSARQPTLLDGSFDALCRGGCAWRMGHGRPDGPEWGEPQRIQFAPFTSALFRRELFERLGGLDEAFGSYLEDVEFGVRCALAGIEGVYVPEARSLHLGSMTLGMWHPDTVRHIAENQLRLIAKHYPVGLLRRWLWQILVAQALWGLVAARHGAVGPYLQGKWRALRSFRRMRAGIASANEVAGARLAAILQQNEARIREVQERTGFDWYWRMYFALT